MKQKNKIFYIILILTTLAGMWILPSLLKKATDKPDFYPFIYYSCMLDDLCIIDHSNKTHPMQDTKGHQYTTAQFDSLQPMLNFRQLMSDARMPDSIKGVAITPQAIRIKMVNYKFRPSEIATPPLELYFLFEAMPKRVGLEIPDDVFRIKDKIEFIDDNTNSVNVEKSNKFQTAMQQEGYTFPTQWAVGNMNPRKPYDEGFFCLDAKGELFHLKMVNNRPYFKNTHISDSINVAYFAMLEVSDKRFYGFLYSKEGDMYIIENEAGGYKTMKLDIDPIDLKQDQILVMGNLFDWTVSVTTPDAKKTYALDAVSLKRVTSYDILRSKSNWETVSEWTLPFYLTFENKFSDYIVPEFHFTAFTAFLANFVLALAIALLRRKTATSKKLFNFVYVLITGIAGFVALLILPPMEKKN